MIQALRSLGDPETKGLMLKSTTAILESLSKLDVAKYKSIGGKKEIKDEFERIVQYLALISVDASLNPNT